MLTPEATASLPKVSCYEHWVKSFMSGFLGRICRSTCNFWYNREPPPPFSEAQILGVIF